MVFFSDPGSTPGISTNLLVLDLIKNDNNHVNMTVVVFN
jgi:hypothetical protein